MIENNTRYNEKNIYNKTRTKSKKSSMNLDDFKNELKAVDMDISKFSDYFGISRSTIYGWSTHGIPIYIERIIELLKIKKELHKGIDELYETNTDKINKLHEINTNEPTKSKKIYYKRSAWKQLYYHYWLIYKLYWEHTLSDQNKLIIDYLLNKYELLSKAYKLKEDFYKIYDAKNKDDAYYRYEKWELQITHDIQPTFKSLTTALGNWHQEIFNYFEHPITNAYTESMN